MDVSSENPGFALDGSLELDLSVFFGYFLCAKESNSRTSAKKDSKPYPQTIKHSKLLKKQISTAKNFTITPAATPVPATHDRQASAAYWPPDADDPLGMRQRK
ncbi:MAG: hypothetical protein WAZ48_03190 [Lysobacteraceae bacterium]